MRWSVIFRWAGHVAKLGAFYSDTANCILWVAVSHGFSPKTLHVVAHSISCDFKPLFVGSSILKPDDHVSEEDLDGQVFLPL